MKFAVVPRVLVLTLVASLALALTGCGFFNNSSHNIALANGNWSIAATSSVPANGTFYIGGNLTQSGSAVSGTLYIAGSLCFDVSQGIAFTGTVNGNKITLASASVQGQVLTITATGNSGSFSGTYTKSSGGNCLTADQGTANANAVPSISGTWSGPITGSGGSNVTLSIALTQASTASADGTFPLTGTLTYTNSTCSTTGTISSGFLAGSYLLLNANTNETDGSFGSLSYTDVLLDSATAPKTMKGNYDVVAGLCGGDLDSPTFTKQ